MIEINDTFSGSQVKFGLDYSQSREVLIFSIFPHDEVVYFDKRRKNVLSPIREIKMYLSINNVKDICAAFIANVSMFFEEKYSKRDFVIKTVNKYKIVIESDKSSERSKIVMTIIDSDKEVIVLRLKKNKILFLLNWIKKVFEGGVGSAFRIKTKCDNGFVYETGRNKDDLLTIRSTVLHQREMDIIRYLAEEMIFSFEPESVFAGRLTHRQVEVFKIPNSNNVAIVIKNKTSKSKEIHIDVDPQSIAALYLSISEISPPQRETPAELRSTTSVITKYGSSYIGFEKIKNQNYDFKAQTGGIKLHFCKTKQEGGVESYVVADLGSKWNLFLASLLEIYNDNSACYKDGRHSSVWRYKTVQPNSEVRFVEIRILSTRDSAQKAAINIKTSKSNYNSSEKLEESISISLTRHQLFSFITSFLGAVSNIKGYEFSFKHHIEPKARLTVKASPKGYTELSTKKDEKSLLSASDSALLKSSARYKMFHDRWLNFQGDQVTISSDGFLTDLKQEYCVDDNYQACNGQKAALSLFLSFGGQL